MNSTTFPFPILPPGTPLFDVHYTFGAAYIGSLASMGLLGATTLQVWYYYNNFPEDRLWMKLMVFCVWIVEFIRSTFTAHAVYNYLVLNWGNVLGLSEIVWSLSSIIIMTNIGELFGHFYFAWRIYKISTGAVRYVLTSLVVVLTLWNFGMGTATFVNLLQAKNLTDYAAGAQSVLAPFALVTAISTDVAIAGSLVFLLNRTRTGFSRTNRLLNTLIFYAIQVGAITVIADVAVINQYIDKLQFMYIGVYAVVGNLYANSLLASLNARASLKVTAATVVSSMHNTTGSRTVTCKAQNAIHLSTFGPTVEVTQEYHYDPESKAGYPGRRGDFSV
ncbi:uncharacterized protein BXZ73DRAFT_96737 [Epithele typhae]|uniref:uncharacterized protein n=1 Tax=Epithele typhae TaxID=378194 RepID=UPI00200733CF|nr:uncharacterized protein BXZ73DRAFT_96737 [Epithele typhae]KAH9944245.1 hypothetical protein BXZ73DRAFT_96737 [Epithele typhae]